MADFPIPSFLENQSAEEIHARMMQQLPDDIDKSEGGHPYNLTMPTAYEASYMAEFIMVEAIKLIFPKYAQDYADIMVNHAETRGLERKAATYATGSITIAGDVGTEIPEGSSFSTASVNGEPAIEFITVDAVTIDTEGTVTVDIMAAEPGTKGNVPAGVIFLKANEITGITSVTNEEETSGGTEEETIESLQARIMEYDETQGVSFVGSESDYKRWALEVGGTGSAVILPPEDDSGLIKIILTDATGSPANDDLCEAVYNHIMRPDSPAERLAPINGGNIQVLAPTTIAITISVTIEINGLVAIETIQSNMLAKLKAYMVEATQDREVRYTRIGSIIANTEGVEDYKLLLLNDGTENIAVSDQELPSLEAENLIVTVGTV